MVNRIPAWIAFGILLFTQVGCDTAMPGTALRPAAAGVPSRITLGTEKHVQTHHFIDGIVSLPAGIYKLIGENERGCFYASPQGVRVNVPLPINTRNADSGFQQHGGVCVQRSGFSRGSALIYATWRGSKESGGREVMVVSPLEEHLSVSTR